MPARSLTRVAALGAIAALSLTACANGANGGSDTGGGDAPTDLIISTDLPLQGASASTSESTNNLIQLYLDQVGNKAGKFNIKLQTYDDSTAAKGAWDDAACAKNATDHVANTNEVAVMGTYNSGCAKIELPTLNQDNMLMVSHANTNPGLTKAWDPGEPDKYYPSGTRNFARTITTDDYQGVGAAAFAANDLKVKKAYVLNDNQTYGLGVARAFEENAQKNGIEIVGKGSWDAKQPNYTALFQSVKASGADIVYLGGIYDNNGGQLVKDKVSVLGPNDGAVKLLAPDGFTGYPDLLALDQSKGMYLTFAGLTQDQLVKAGGEGAKLLDAYKAKYNKAPDGSYPLYGVAATQVILDAISKSDGTRKSVTDQVLGGAGITIPADQSVLGKEIKIDPATGDTSAKDLTIEVIKDNKETFFKSQSIS